MTVDMNEASVEEICRAQVLLAAAVRRLESRFIEIVEFDPECEDASRTPGGTKYTTYAGGIEFPEYGHIPRNSCAITPSDAVAIFERNVLAMKASDSARLFWRKRPEILPCDDNLWFVRCRLAFC